jgi:hypothetical protein
MEAGPLLTIYFVGGAGTEVPAQQDPRSGVPVGAISPRKEHHSSLFVQMQEKIAEFS